MKHDQSVPADNQKKSSVIVHDRSISFGTVGCIAISLIAIVIMVIDAMN